MQACGAEQLQACCLQPNAGGTQRRRLQQCGSKRRWGRGRRCGRCGIQGTRPGDVAVRQCSACMVLWLLAQTEKPHPAKCNFQAANSGRRQRATTYDANNSFHPPLCEQLVALADIAPGSSILDVCCGTGTVAFAAAAAAGPTGRVVGVDISEAMLEQVKRPAAIGLPS